MLTESSNLKKSLESAFELNGKTDWEMKISLGHMLNEAVKPWQRLHYECMNDYCFTIIHFCSWGKEVVYRKWFKDFITGHNKDNANSGKLWFSPKPLLAKGELLEDVTNVVPPGW